jgi:serine protease AprX
MQREQVEELFYGKANQQRRFTQDFPILPDVWIAYGAEPSRRQELLLTPHNESDAPTLARALRERFGVGPEDGARPKRGRKARADVAGQNVLFNESVVMTSLTFHEMLRDALPLTDWWKRIVRPIVLGGKWNEKTLRAIVASDSTDARRLGKMAASVDPRLLQKLVRIVGCIELARQGKPVPKESLAGAIPTDVEIVAFVSVFARIAPVSEDATGILWSISLNRPASSSVWRSRLTVKADAAARLFEAKTAGIRWAVLDTGIDATHDAFRRRNPKTGKVLKPTPDDIDDGISSRVVRTYDFMRIKTLLNSSTPPDTKGTVAALMPPAKLKILTDDLQRNLKNGRSIDWDLLEPFLRVPHSPKAYHAPTHDSHGTHVAGILAANWQEAPDVSPIKEPMLGVCPDLELYDFRVLPDDPKDTSDEFTIIAALQFIRHMNDHKDLMVVHGVNLSLSVPHDVANYACGRTPVCQECERVVANGLIVVTAAGNRGFNRLADPDNGAVGDYRYISITDPGNADGVITVGSTHRIMPHNYGVSYFSSRGPTGDGRTKPDLLAPGERIDSCSLNGYYETMDGTSMAAPHVSGAAALLISRHRELIGQPQQVKKLLCDNATDLGREPRFQGHGMVDVLRALQSV